jgi:uncharacterized protein (DUF736 family)
MAEYDNKNSGALFKNDKKEDEKHPDYRGNVNAAGVDYWLDAWLKKDKNGKTYMRLRLKPKG